MRGEFRGVTDHFAALGIPRAPWVDGEVLKERFHRVGAEAHPDGGGSSAAFAAVNEAWQTLRTAAGCLRHFLELEHPDALAPAGHAPPELADLFMEIAGVRQAVNQFVAEREQAGSPLGRALLEPARLGLVEKIGELSAEIASKSAEAIGEVRTAEAARQAELLGRLVFLGKWEAQVRELGVAI